MKIEKTNKEIKLEFFKGLYESAMKATRELYTELERNMEQYRGSDEIDGSQERATTVRNITYEIIESEVNSDIPMPKADPASYNERRGRNAESIERLCRSIRDRLPFEQMNDMDERYTYIYGGSVWYVEWDNSEKVSGEIGGVKVRCLSPKDFIPQPGIYSIEDMEYCFLKFTTTRGELMRMYGLSEGEVELLECEYEYSDGDFSSDAVAMIICFYRDDDGEVGRLVFSGDIILSDLPRYYMRRGVYCTACGEEEASCRCGGRKEEREIRFESILKDDKDRSAALGCEEGLKASIPYYVPKRFPIVIRKNTSGEDALFGQSDCTYIRPEQQAINKVESRILQKLLRAGITPIVPEDARITLNNSVFGQVIKMKPGESASQYGKVDTTPDISQDVIEAERLYDHAKRVIGVSDAYLGIDQSYHESGVARQLKISQASGRLESKRRMKHTAYAELDKIIFSLYLAFSDEPRALSYKDAYGRIHSAQFNRYDFIEYDPESESFYYDDDYLFSVDMNGASEYQRENMWQRNLENLKAGTLGNPESPVTLLRYWQCQERAHYPYARENVEYFTAEVEKEGGGVILEQGFA